MRFLQAQPQVLGAPAWRSGPWRPVRPAAAAAPRASRSRRAGSPVRSTAGTAAQPRTVAVGQALGVVDHDDRRRAARGDVGQHAGQRFDVRSLRASAAPRGRCRSRQRSDCSSAIVNRAGSSSSSRGQPGHGRAVFQPAAAAIAAAAWSCRSRRARSTEDGGAIVDVVPEPLQPLALHRRARHARRRGLEGEFGLGHRHASGARRRNRGIRLASGRLSTRTPGCRAGSMPASASGRSPVRTARSACTADVALQPSPWRRVSRRVGPTSGCG